MTTAETTAFFTRAWSVYDQIAEHNYMSHREIYAKVAGLLKLRKDHNQYRLLDLGCGNARFLAPCLMQSPPSHYHGVDMSEVALEEARTYLAELSCPIELTRGDLLEAVKSTDKKWDVIFTGFALHHLTSEEKARFFRAAGRCLSDNGWLLMVDIVREENQGREDYLEDYLKLMRECWTQIPPDQLETVCEHVATHDYPEYLSSLQEMAKVSGLNSSRVIGRYGQHCAVLFSRDALSDIGMERATL
jgi:cyclopropane fatty-acyl-phospholipid synthase-like methyltransferase